MSVISGTVAALAGSSAAGKQADAARDAGAAQLQGTRESIAAQKEAADKAAEVFTRENQAARDFLERQYGIARQALDPARRIQDRALKEASQLAMDPNSPAAMAERKAAALNIARGLSSTGGLNSSRMAALTRDVELGLARQRFDRLNALGNIGATQATAGLAEQLGQGGAGLAQGLGSQLGSLYGNFGQNIGQTIQQGAAQQGSSLLALGQARAAQGLAVPNAIQGSIGNAVNYGVLAKTFGLI